MTGERGTGRRWRPERRRQRRGDRRSAMVCGLAAAAALWAMSSPVEGQTGAELGALRQRISALEQDLQILRQQLAREGGAPPQGALGAPSSGRQLADAEIRLSGLEDQLRQMTGQIEEIGHRVAQAEARLDRLVTDVDFRLRALESPGGAPMAPAAGDEPAAGAAAPPPGVLGTLPLSAGGEGAAAATGEGPAASAILPEGPPEDQYRYANLLIQQGKYADAEAALRAFLAEHEDHALAANAQYWLGETFYARNQYDRAAAAFLTGLQKYPDGTKGADSQLKLGLSLSGMEEAEQACRVLTELENRYPDASEIILNRARQEIGRLACP